MKRANIHEAKTTLSKLIEMALAGEEVVVCKAGKPLVRLVAYESVQARRVPGVWKGKIEVAAGFDDELPPEVLDGFLGGEG